MSDARRGSTQLENIGQIEKRLWTGADTLRANSNFASNEYFLPVMGLIFLRHAYSRFLKVKADIENSLPSRKKISPEKARSFYARNRSSIISSSGLTAKTVRKLSSMQ
jgi:type I restriction enzyme M protein